MIVEENNLISDKPMFIVEPSRCQLDYEWFINGKWVNTGNITFRNLRIFLKAKGYKDNSAQKSFIFYHALRKRKTFRRGR